MRAKPRSVVVVLFGAALGVAQAAGAAPPQRLVIAGDSTASSYEPARHPRMGWGQVLDRFLAPGIDVLNRAVSGRSTRSYVDLGHFEPLAAELRPGDVLLIQFGHNDEKQEDPTRYTEPREAFPAGLRRFVEAARRAGARPVLLTPVARRRFDAQGRMVDTHGEYADAVRKLAAAESVPLVDLGRLSFDYFDALGPEASKAYFLHDPVLGLADDTHFSERGAVAVACLVAGGLIERGLLATTDLVRDADCGVPADHRERHAAQARPSLIEHQDRIAVVQPGPHGGHGMTIASPFFKEAPGFGFAVRRRVLRDGASIGLHAHGKDEVYYVLSGRGELSLDGELHTVVPGTAILTRDGSTHALRQVGSEDLAILIVYATTPKP
jgi:lysophospholipase L1-like esterase/quercetin dioxygenase-like cupin family protein